MACEDSLPEFVRTNYEVREWRHACAILQLDFPDEWNDIVTVLSGFRLKKGYIAPPGGNKSLVSSAIDLAFNDLGWREKRWDTTVTLLAKVRLNRSRAGVVGAEPPVNRESPTHNVDCFKNKVALEIEWNNKDPFFDRDLNNFRLLFELHAVSVGIIITRCDELQDIFNRLGRGRSYGNSTTHMSKLIPRIEGGGSGGCPVLVFGIRKSLYVDDGVVEPRIEALSEIQSGEGDEEDG